MQFVRIVLCSDVVVVVVVVILLFVVVILLFVAQSSMCPKLLNIFRHKTVSVRPDSNSYSNISYLGLIHQLIADY